MTFHRSEGLSQSVHQRLLNHSRKTGDNFNLLLVRYAIERLLYRISQSQFVAQFVLKGALLFVVWDVPVHRPTRDLDLLGFGENSREALSSVFREICELKTEPDGLFFDPATFRMQQIRDAQKYGGLRLDLIAFLGQAQIPVRVDIGFGDIVVPQPVRANYPVILDFPVPQLRVYSRETVIAEKLHAMTELDLTNSRIKDFYDLWILSRYFSFDGATLAAAIGATFERRRTAISVDPPIGLTPAFSENMDKVTQWRAFVGRNRLDVEGLELAAIVAEVAAFVDPPRRAAAGHSAFASAWSPAGPWQAAGQQNL